MVGWEGAGGGLGAAAERYTWRRMAAVICTVSDASIGGFSDT